MQRSLAMTIIDLKSAIKSSAYPKDLYVSAPMRCMYLAYAYMREIPYRVAEPTALPFFERLGHYHGIPKAVAFIVKAFGGEVTEKDIEAWVAVPESDVRAEKRRVAEAKSAVIRAAKRAEHMQKIALARGLKVAC